MIASRRPARTSFTHERFVFGVMFAVSGPTLGLWVWGRTDDSGWIGTAFGFSVLGAFLIVVAAKDSRDS